MPRDDMSERLLRISSGDFDAIDERSSDKVIDAAPLPPRSRIDEESVETTKAESVQDDSMASAGR